MKLCCTLPAKTLRIVPGTADFGPGNVRLSFLVVDSQSRVVTRPKAKVWLAHDLKGKPFLTTTARSERIGVPGGDDADVGAIFVTRLNIPKPGKYWLLAEPIGGRKIQAVGNVVVKDKPAGAGRRRPGRRLGHAYARQRDDQAVVDVDACQTASSTRSR